MRIVVVEDEAPIREGLANLLNKINPEYELAGTAADGEAGYHLIRETEPDLVIMDIRMPKMDGLTMMKKLRTEGQKCKVIVLSAYSDFSYAQEAISLKIESYLLKPIKIPDLRKALQQVEEAISEDQNAEQIFSVENIMLACMHGQMRQNMQMNKTMQQKFGISLDDPAELFGIWLGCGYGKQKKIARQLLKTVGEHTIRYKFCVLESDSWQLLTMVIYQAQNGESQRERFEKSVVPMLNSQLEAPIVCLWKSIERLVDMPEALQEIRIQREWNLMFPQGTLISSELIAQQHPVPLKYPVDLEEKAKQAVLQENKEELKKCFRKLANCYKEELHTPSDIKQAIIHLSLAVFGVYKAKASSESDLEVQNILQEITVAISWSQVEGALKKFFNLFAFESQDEEEGVSVLVKQAKKLIRKYYDQGITLEEIANRLYVSEEYLSAQFKKETGSTFTETIRKYRIEKVKQLLLNTHLKLNQIAELAGYSDPKYMSKVFKEEVGMLPTDFRKSVH
ncbi:MAG: response regulator [[Ruminococcus] gnavus]|nr:response regulator [Mediterraneibacter gnavus]